MGDVNDTSATTEQTAQWAWWTARCASELPAPMERRLRAAAGSTGQEPVPLKAAEGG
jgi:hypothetical protein